MYYPKAKISTNQYTGGGLLKDTITGETYRGYYYVSFDGRYFSGVSQSISSDELVLIQSSSIAPGTINPLVAGSSIANFQYDTITKNKMSFLNQGGIPTPIYPSPDSDDYDNGQFIRYFMQRIGGNAKDIKEISKDGVTALNNNPLYSTLNLTWKLTGPVNDIVLPTYTIYGVASTNQRTALSLEKTMNGISKYLINPLELARIMPVVIPKDPFKPKQVVPKYSQNPPTPNPVVVLEDDLTDFDGSILIDFDGSNLLAD